MKPISRQELNDCVGPPAESEAGAAGRLILQWNLERGGRATLCGYHRNGRIEQALIYVRED